MVKTAIQEMIMVLMGLLVIGMTSASAQTASLGPGEISCTTADSLSDIWFRHTYLTQRRPISATLSVTRLAPVMLSQSGLEWKYLPPCTE